MKTTTYAKLSKFVGKPINNLDCSVTEFTEKRIIEYATNQFIAYRTIQTNDTEAKDIKIVNNFLHCVILSFCVINVFDVSCKKNFFFLVITTISRYFLLDPKRGYCQR